MHPGGVIRRMPVPANYDLASYQCFCAGTALFKFREEGKSGFPLAEPQAACPAHRGPSAHT